MIASRLNPWWKLLATHEAAEGDRCVDLFTRPDQSFGFAEFRRDVGDSGSWTPVGGFADLSYSNPDSALLAAREKVGWLGAVLDRPATRPESAPLPDKPLAPSSINSRQSRRTRPQLS